MEERYLKIFRRYLDDGFSIFTALVEHPAVRDPDSFAACSIVLQRAAIVFRDGRQDLFLRSYFHSSNGRDFVNFAPAGVVRFSFPTDSIWFPLELTYGIPEPRSEVVLDILTRGALPDGDLPKPFEVADRSRLSLGASRYDVTRISGTLDSGEQVRDLRLKVGGPRQKAGA